MALALTYWPFFTRLVFAEEDPTWLRRRRFLSTPCKESASSSARIVFIHILPNAISPIIVRATIGLGFTILVAAVLGFTTAWGPPRRSPIGGWTISKAAIICLDA